MYSSWQQQIFSLFENLPHLFYFDQNLQNIIGELENTLTVLDRFVEQTLPKNGKQKILYEEIIPHFDVNNVFLA